MKTDLYFESNEVKINGEKLKGKVKLSVKELIEIVKKNSGNLWGVCPRPNFCLGDGAAFQILLDKKKNVYYQIGNRMLPSEIKTQTKQCLEMWTACYKNGMEKIYVGKATPKEEIEILQLNDKAVVFI